MTIDACRSHCRGSRTRYAALQGSITCYCSDQIFTLHSESGDRNCNWKCLGNKFEACGAQNYLSIYDGKHVTIPDDEKTLQSIHKR